MATPEILSTRRPYHGSCHCGHTKYVAFLTLPPTLTTTADRSGRTRIYKCNCSTCHKAGIFHVRLPSSPDDFILLSPLDPRSELGDYTCFKKRIHWYFCPKCGVRCFSLWGEGEVAEVDLASIGVEDGGGEGKLTKVWRPKKEGWEEGKNSYLSVNAVTLEPGQEGFSLREWTEKNWVWYLNSKDEEEEARLGEPHEGGCY